MLCFLSVQYLSLIHSGMGDIEPDPLPEGTGDGVGGVDPAVGVQHVLQRSAIEPRILVPILHTAWLENHALTLKRNTEKKYYFGKKIFLHTFLKLIVNQGKFRSSSKSFHYKCYRCF
jgi:hypothetical protein